MTGRSKYLNRNHKSKQETYYDCCRICRADQTPDEEPLFHPCRCRGSIKFVHQSCLMDWLMTSKKKRCDLCKAAYRFAKFYDPLMPRKLPTSVLAKYFIKRGIEKGVFALRVGLVGAVWLVVVPMFTRHNWTFFFWVSEEGLVGSSHATTAAAAAAAAATAAGQSNGSRIANFSSSVLSAGTSILQLVGLAEPASLVSPANATNATNSSSAASVASGAAASSIRKSASWLSDTPYINNLTRSSAVNRLIVHCIEGIAITLVVVVCFILIILVRDYVLQHQRGPEANAFDQFFEEFPIDFNRLEEKDELFDEEYHDDSEPSEDDFKDIDAPTPEIGDNLYQYLRIRRKARGIPHRIVGMAHAEGLEEDLKQWLEPLYPITGRPPPGYGRPAEEPAEEPRDGLAEGPVQGPVQGPVEAGPAAAEEPEEESSDDDELAEAGPSSQDGPSPSGDSWTIRSENGSIGTSPSTTTVDLNETPEPAETTHDTAQTNGVDILEFEYRPRANTGPLTTGGGSGLGNNYWAFPPDLADTAQDQDMPAPEPDNEDLVNGHREYDVNDEYGDHEEEYQNHNDDELYDDDEGEWEDTSDEDLLLPVQNAPVANTRMETAALALPRPVYDSGSELGQHLPEAQPEQPNGIIGNIAHFMWRDLDQIDPGDLPPLPDPEEDNHALIGELIGDAPAAQEADAFGGLIVPRLDDDMDLGGLQNEDGLNWEDQEAEAEIEGEDFEGMMELVGMNGPLVALFQNAMFCLFLVIVTLLLGTFLPYNVGRFTIWLVANPTRPVLLLFSIAQIIQDGAATVLGLGALVTLLFLHGCVQMLQIVGISAPSELLASYIDEVRRLVLESTIRFVQNFRLDALITPAGEIRNFSAISHEALLTLKGQWSSAMGFIGRIFYALFTDTWGSMASHTANSITTAATAAWSLVAALPSALSSPSAWVISFETSDDSLVDPGLAHWDDGDRFLASMFGYATVFLVGWWYLKKARTAHNLNDPAHEWERAIVDVLTQASGVLKVTLIIGIEMFAFPLYCGSMLDLALLPLFEGATVMTRLTFLYNFPLTSLFMHWLAGTTYMFHFSLFVFMCRKLLRKGVLFFIRDPENNPVRDALDRSVGTHLKKILWSALAYGIMISAFIGGTLWTLSYATAGTGLMPIHYSSNEFVFEFPYDLVLYIVVMPVAVKTLKLHDTAYAINEWWFRKSARALRLTWFLFNERRIDEEGELKLEPDSAYRKYPWYITYFLSYDEASDTVYPVLLGPPSTSPTKAEKAADTTGSANAADAADAKNAPASAAADESANIGKQDEHAAKLQPAKRRLVQSGRMTHDGWFVRAPTADNIKIVSAQKVFLRVTELNERRDDRVWEEDIYNTDYFQQVYMPPHFTMRYRLYIFSVWTFAVLGGVVAVFCPLLAGRGVFSLFVPAGVPYNDVFAFNTGVYVLSALGYVAINARKWLTEATPQAAGQLLQKIYNAHRQAHVVIYSYLTIAIISPLLAAGIVELYVFIPLHTYMFPPQAEGSSTTPNDPNDASRYTVELKQVWVLGVLFLQLAVLYVSYNFPHSRVASALRAVFRRGRWVPDARILTRALVVPGLVMALAAIFVPLALASVLSYVCEAPCLWVLDHLLDTTTDAVILRRFCYPLVAAIVVGLFRVYGIAANFQAWRTLVRDEVYLIGTRVQNYGPTSIPQVRKIDPITGF